MAILLKGCKADSFKSHNSLKIIQDLRSKFVGCEFLLESTFPDVLVLCEAKLDDSIDSGSLSVRGYLPLIRKNSVTQCMVLQFM